MLLLRKSASRLALYERRLAAGGLSGHTDDVVIEAFEQMISDGAFAAAECLLADKYALLSAHLLRLPTPHSAFVAHLARRSVQQATDASTEALSLKPK